ncbi:MAG: bifunctional ornithine acetyltransferase/N-acetylglutamate synthase [Spirochaetales bacterium]|nr:bifunctional ornithine acetyltransferase/N-acetylglutamate synthase [Spirochaetales bacterium]
MEYTSKQAYEDTLKKRALLPEGFTCSTSSLTFFPGEKPVKNPLQMNLSLILSHRDITSFGAVYTQNRFPGAPVLIGKKRLLKPSVRGILVNNKISNVCTKTGVVDAEELLDSLGRILSIPGSSFIPASTGIIGWGLPVGEMKKALPLLVDNLNSASLFDVAKAIMTTDSFPKLRSTNLGKGRITAIAKGAGMIEPNMATLLVFILTDIEIPRMILQQFLADAVDVSFNTISVDGDQSTSDTAIILSSALTPCKSLDDFKNALITVCKDLAEDIVRNGEGTSHVIKVKVKGDCDVRTGTGIGKAIVNSPLVKTAIFGNDPNVGRIIGAIGDFLGNHRLDIDTKTVMIKMGETDIFSGSAFILTPAKEKQLYQYLKQAQLNPEEKGYPLHENSVEIEVRLGNGGNCYTIIGSDLSYEYVRENADYRS